MQAAAHTKGGVGGVSQSVGKEFAASDKGGALPARKTSRAQRLYKGAYAEGGAVGQSEAERDAAMARYQKMVEDRRKSGGAEDVDAKADAVRQSDKFKTDGVKHPNFHSALTKKLQSANDVEENRVDPTPATKDANELTALPSRRAQATEAILDYPEDTELAKGGTIKKVAGKPIGKDDGIIAAQVGEYVVKKAAANKLGTKVLDAVNKGDLSKAERLYSARKMKGFAEGGNVTAYDFDPRKAAEDSPGVEDNDEPAGPKPESNEDITEKKKNADFHSGSDAIRARMKKAHEDYDALSQRWRNMPEGDEKDKIYSDMGEAAKRGDEAFAAHDAHVKKFESGRTAHQANRVVERFNNSEKDVSDIEEGAKGAREDMEQKRSAPKAASPIPMSSTGGMIKRVASQKLYGARKAVRRG